jgi:hypothetical protein
MRDVHAAYVRCGPVRIESSVTRETAGRQRCTKEIETKERARRSFHRFFLVYAHTIQWGPRFARRRLHPEGRNIMVVTIP